ncbi:MAG: hypothetical protein U0V48_16570 [Anaerolineales bacterium]
MIIPEPLTGDVPTDKKMIYDALAAGRCFVGYDLPAPTKGFIFKAKGLEQSAIMGEEISVKGGVTLHAHTPIPSDIHLIKDGQTDRRVEKIPTPPRTTSTSLASTAWKRIETISAENAAGSLVIRSM